MVSPNIHGKKPNKDNKPDQLYVASFYLSANEIHFVPPIEHNSTFFYTIKLPSSFPKKLNPMFCISLFIKQFNLSF